MKLTRDAYEALVAGDIAWLARQPRSLEREHIAMILEASPAHEYREPGEIPLLHSTIKTLRESLRTVVAKSTADKDKLRGALQQIVEMTQGLNRSDPSLIYATGQALARAAAALRETDP